MTALSLDVPIDLPPRILHAPLRRGHEHILRQRFIPAEVLHALDHIYHT